MGMGVEVDQRVKLKANPGLYATEMVISYTDNVNPVNIIVEYVNNIVDNFGDVQPDEVVTLQGDKEIVSVEVNSLNSVDPFYLTALDMKLVQV